MDDAAEDSTDSEQEHADLLSQTKQDEGVAAPEPQPHLDMQALRALKKPQLRKRAAELGASAKEIEAARDEEDEKEAMLRLIEAAAARLSRKEADLREAEPDTESLDMQALRSLKKPELRKRAAEMGASEEEIEAARDEDDEKAAMLRLIVAHADAQASLRNAAPPDVRFEDIREIEGSVRLVRHLESMTERVSKKFRDQLQYARERDNLLLCKDAKGEVRMPPFVHPRVCRRAPLLLLLSTLVLLARFQRRGHARSNGSRSSWGSTTRA
eukprot:COSAG04_NODE_6186_length_1390_cov_1.673896_2_plen_270_part_00